MNFVKKSVAIVVWILFFVSQIIGQTNVPDANFRTRLSTGYGITFDASNNITNPTVAASKTTIDVAIRGITDLTGIEAFTAMQTLNCSNNSLTKLNLSANIHLRQLICYYNQIDSLDLASNSELLSVSCYNNKIKFLNIPNSQNIATLDCSGNLLTELDVSAITNLQYLTCSNNFIELDLTSNTKLVRLFCQFSTNLASINITGLTLLEELYCFNTGLTSLDLSTNTGLKTVLCRNSQIETLTLSNHPLLTTLTCYSNKITSLDVSGCTALNFNLDCSTNQITTLNFSSNLATLNCGNNKIVTLNFPEVPQLTSLSCNSNLIENLDVSSLIKLTMLYCQYNMLTSLNISTNVNLTQLDCSGNQLTALDFSLNPKLVYIACPINKLTALDVSNLSKLTDLICNTNQLTSLNVIPLTGETSLKTINCIGNKLTELDVSADTALTQLRISLNLTPFILGVQSLPFPTAKITAFTDTNPASTKILGPLPLPVEMISFNLTLTNNNQVILKWETVTETNNSGWDVESCETETKNSEWQKIGFVGGKGTTTEKQNYSFIHQVNRISKDNRQYRLKQIDLDGMFSYSNILTVNSEPESFRLFQNYPNPFNPETVINYYLADNSFVDLTVYDLNGREVSTIFSRKEIAGHHSAKFNAVNLPSGIYFYRINAGRFSATRSMTVIK